MRGRVGAGIRARRLADGTTVYDAGVGSVHLGTHATGELAEEALRYWRQTLETDRQILEERRLAEERQQALCGELTEQQLAKRPWKPDREYRWGLLRVQRGNERWTRPPLMLEWADPVGDLVAARVDAERELARQRRGELTGR